MIINNLEVLFNIKIKKFNFIYILEYEKKDTSLIEFCEKMENQINYFFYSIEKNKFVDINGEEIHIAKYITDIRFHKNIIKYIDNNRERDEKLLKSLLSKIPIDYDIEEEYIFLTKKTARREEKKKDINKCNFLCIFDLDEKLILPNDCNSKTKYEEDMKKKKNSFFDEYFEIKKKKDEKDIDNNLSEKQSDNQKLDITSELKIIDENSKLKEDYHILEDIITNTRNKIEFSDDYNSKLERIISEEYKEEYKKMKGINNENDNLLSLFFGFLKLNILNNTVELPFYYLYRNKESKEIKIFLKNNGKIDIFKYNDETKIINDDFKKEINNLINTDKFQEENLIVLCCLYIGDKKRCVKKKNDDIYAL